MAKILFVDDVPEICRLYSTVLTKKGHEVVIAQSVMQAMRSLKNASYDYVFVDIKIPDFDGFDLLKQARFRTEYPDTKVIILSNSESAKDYKRAMALGAERYLVKVDYSPYGLAQLIEQGQL